MIADVDEQPTDVVEPVAERVRPARVWGVAMFRDEGDIAYHSVMHMGEEGLDGILVVDNLSEDDTPEQLARARTDLAGTCEVVVETDPDPAYYQSRKVTALARRAAERGADWIVPFDADELWYGRDRVGWVLRHLPEGCDVAVATLFNHFPTSIDPADPNPFVRTQWREGIRGALPKVAFRWRDDAVVLQGNHDVVYGGRDGPEHRVPGPPALELRHFPYRSYPQFRRKAVNGAAAYAATDLPASEGAHWRQYGRILDMHGDDGPLGLRAVYETYFTFIAPVEAGMVLDPAPFRRWSKEPASPADKEQG